MRCRTADRLMSLQLDRTLAAPDAARLSEHLQRCARCQAHWVAMQDAHGCLSDAPWKEPASGFTNRVLARLPQERRALVPQSPLWARASLVVMAAMTVLLVGVGATLLLLMGTLPTDWANVGQGSRTALAAAWATTRLVAIAGGDILGALWLGLRWPWAPIVLGAGVAAALVVGWLARRGRRRTVAR